MLAYCLHKCRQALLHWHEEDKDQVGFLPKSGIYQ